MTPMVKLMALSALALPLTFLSVNHSVSTVASNAVLAAPPLTTSISRNDFGIDVFSYDSQLNLPSTIPTLQTLGMGMQQFPNDNQWSWVSNTFRNGGTGAVSLNDWSHILQATDNSGLFIFNYDENPTFTGGGDAQDATLLTQYIVSHHLPISAIVIGSEEYGPWDFAANMNTSHSAAYYAQSAAQIAQAIHAVDPEMKVGISFSLGMGSYSRNWNQTVLRTDAPYINFVSIHDYPLASNLSNTELLTQIPQYISQAMNYVHEEIAANVPLSLAGHIQTWVTEYNPCGEPGPQSISPVYGAAMVESAMLWRAEGASKLFVWSYDGQAHVATPSWPVATNANAPFGLFALAGDGQSPELPANTLYPSGQALSQLMNAIGQGGVLSTWTNSSFVVGAIKSNVGQSLFLINETARPQSVTVNDQTYEVPGASLLSTTTTAPIFSLSLSQNTEGSTLPKITYHKHTPVIQSPGTVYDGEVVTLQGLHLGSAMKAPAYVQISQNNVNYGGPGDDYHIAISQWTPTSVTFKVPNGYSGPGLANGPATIELATDNGVVSNIAPVMVTPPPQLGVSLSPDSALQPGTILTITGTNLGATQGSGYVLISQNGINYGAPSDWYKIHILQWTNSHVVLVIPNGSSGPALLPGTATLQVTNSTGEQSPLMSLTIRQ
ncbi:IPT/TIG domain-containing protein [Sulfobacillus sp. hq2]|uniref:IPT/TIG domain-containing protein n=1 Tax=Sulfobacillus sp. hq2 TaxID=2039167 RepID=UPI000CD1E327|nr:IPT/TIG domain-containing protein [Sulfobacillus sp. hq2]POB10217.1 cell surface protein [Sulfobacillus sp. hq2]